MRNGATIEVRYGTRKKPVLSSLRLFSEPCSLHNWQGLNVNASSPGEQLPPCDTLQSPNSQCRTLYSSPVEVESKHARLKASFILNTDTDDCHPHGRKKKRKKKNRARQLTLCADWGSKRRSARLESCMHYFFPSVRVKGHHFPRVLLPSPLWTTTKNKNKWAGKCWSLLSSLEHLVMTSRTENRGHGMLNVAFGSSLRTLVDPLTVLVVNGGILHARSAYCEWGAQKICG